MVRFGDCLSFVFYASLSLRQLHFHFHKLLLLLFESHKLLVGFTWVQLLGRARLDHLPRVFSLKPLFFQLFLFSKFFGVLRVEGAHPGIGELAHRRVHHDVSDRLVVGFVYSP